MNAVATIPSIAVPKPAMRMDIAPMPSQRLDLSAMEARFVAYLRSNSHATKATYISVVRRLVEFLRETDATQPTRDDILAYYDRLTAEGKSPSTINLYITGARIFFQWLEDEGIWDNIVRRIPVAKVDKNYKKDYLGRDAMRKVLATTEDGDGIESLRNNAMLLLMATTGMRGIEVRRATIGSLDIGAGMLFIQRKGRTSASEYVKVQPRTMEAILAYLSARGEHSDEAPLFCSHSNNSNGKPLSAQSVSAIAKTAMRTAGYDSPRLTAHSLRHTFAISNLLAGGSLEETQVAMGHAKSDTTRIYTHMVERIRNESEARVDAYLFG